MANTQAQPFRLTPACTSLTTASEPLANFLVGIYCGELEVESFTLSIPESVHAYKQDKNLGCVVFKAGLTFTLLTMEGAYTVTINGTIEEGNTPYPFSGNVIAVFPPS